MVILMNQILIHFDQFKKKQVHEALKGCKILVEKSTRIIYETPNTFEEERARLQGLVIIVGQNEQVDPV